MDETIELILAKYNSQQLSKEHLQFEATALKKISGINSNTLGEINRGKVDFIASIYRLLGLSENHTLDGLIYKEMVTHLTARERTFIEKHDFRAITTDKCAPFNLRSSDGELSGIAIDYWNLIQNKTHLQSHYLIADAWQEVLDSLKGNTADLTISTGITDDRKEYALFSKPYASFPIALATINDKGFISSASYLQDKKVAVGRGYSAYKILKQNYPDIEFILADNITHALKLVSDGKAFAAAEIFPVLASKIGELGYTNIKISGTTKFNFDVRIMVRKEYPELISIINKGIESISEDENKTIHNKWIAVNYQQGTDYSLLWKIGLPLTLLLLVFYLWNIKLKHEISRRKSAERQLKHLATTDKFTKIHNRYKIEPLLDQQLGLFRRYHRSVSVTFIDLDNFKKINDTYGHTNGG
ncbi:MAG: transporter substrate-binding domain-containing protein [Thiotrichaceae bacterium]